MSSSECSKKTVTPCREACPAGVNIPGYIRFVREGKFAQALSVIRESMPFPGACGYACVHPCEMKCARVQYDQPVAIRMLKRAAVEYGGDSWKKQFKPAPSTGKKVAVIGAGPCGLTAAHYLSGKGHRVVVFEALPEAGGMMRYGIPGYRLPNDILNLEIGEIISRGVELKTNTEVTFPDEMLNQGFDAVFIATGAWAVVNLGMESNSPAILDGIAFLQDVNSGGNPAIGPRIAVIGGGNTAIDAARASVRLGAKEVVVIYRRGREEMPASPEEIADALEEGVKIEFLAAPVKARDQKLTCVRMKLGPRDASGRPAPVPVEGSEFTVDCDTVIAAIGQKVDAVLLGVESNADGTIKTEKDTLATSRKGVFAAGDAVTGPSSIIQAIAQGKRASVSIDKFLDGDGNIAESLVIDSDPGLKPVVPTGAERPAVRTLDFGNRLNTFASVEEGYSKNTAMREAHRCLGCDIREYRVEVDFSACKQCGYCKAVCGPEVFKQSEGFNDRGYNPVQAANTERCVGCYQCFFVCPDFAISIEKVGGVEL